MATETHDTATPRRPRRLIGFRPARAGGGIATAAIATTAAFAGGGLLTQIVVVPHWRDMDPAAFLSAFAIHGPALGAVLFPIEIGAVLLLGITTYSAAREHRPGRLAWALATACMVGTVVLLPVYFLGANLALLDPAFPPHVVPAELTAWYRWNWVRTGLALAATVLSCVALTAGLDDRRTGRRAGASHVPA